MKVEPSRKQREILETGRVARMATVDQSGNPHIVPICYAFVSGQIYTPIDKKPKNVPFDSLTRIKNINSNPNVSFIIDKYYEDWNRLFFLKISGLASLIYDGEEYENALMSLCEKYPQYLDMDLLNLGLPIIRISPGKIISWGDITTITKDR